MFYGKHMKITRIHLFLYFLQQNYLQQYCIFLFHTISLLLTFKVIFCLHAKLRSTKEINLNRRYAFARQFYPEQLTVQLCILYILSIFLFFLVKPMTLEMSCSTISATETPCRLQQYCTANLQNCKVNTFHNAYMI